MKLYIKNMVCNRCIMVVESELQKFGLHPLYVNLGIAEVEEDLNEEEKKALDQILFDLGFRLISDKRSRLIEQIKTSVLDLIYNEHHLGHKNLSSYLADKLHHDYSYLSNIFSEIQGTTIEKFFISQRIERVKELLVYDEMSLSEIADSLGFSSVSHLSNQFKKITGLTPTYFKSIRDEKRTPIDEL